MAEDKAALKALPPSHLWPAYILAVWTGHRQGDLFRLPWTGYDGQYIRLKQRKGGRRGNIPVGSELKTSLDSAAKAKTAVTILITTNSTPCPFDCFRTLWVKTVTKSKVTGLTFHRLRGTALTRTALSCSTQAEIAALTGHSLKDVAAILEAHDLDRYSRMAESALLQREARETETKIPNQALTAPNRSPRNMV